MSIKNANTKKKLNFISKTPEKTKSAGNLHVPIYINGAFLGLNQYLPGFFRKLHFFKQVLTMMPVMDFSGKNLFSLNLKWTF